MDERGRQDADHLGLVGDGLVTVFRPEFQPQNPAVSHCDLGWLSCTSFAMAMLIDRSSLGVKQPSGCSVRRQTGDKVGGTTLNQNALVAEAIGIDVTVRVGARVISPESAARELKKGRSVVVQGDAGAMVGGPHQSTNGPVAHAVYVNEGRHWDGDMPAEVLVYDPAADGRRSGIDRGPSWWKWTELLKFAAALRPDGPSGPRLGPGRWYAAFGPDTEPHVLLWPGAVKSDPFPDRMRAKRGGEKTGTPVYAAPMTTAKIVRRFAHKGDLWLGYQRLLGKGWYGNQDGTEWVQGGQMDYEGGST